MFATLLLSLCQAPDAPQPRCELPAGPLAEAVRRLDPGVKPAALDPDDRSADWSQPPTIERWGRALEAAAGAQRSGRAALALLALRQGRAGDAWDHVAACKDDPALLAALLPCFLPGADVAIEGDAPLPDGAVLRPATPPRTRAPVPGRPERREMHRRGLRVGDAVLDLRVAVEPEGVQIDVKHVSGGVARLAIAIPREEGYALASEYVNWFRQEETGIAHRIEVGPDAVEFTLYGRFDPRPSAFPALVPGARPAVLEHGGLEIRPSPAPGGAERAAALARVLARPPLRLAARVRAPDAPAGAWTPLCVDLSDPAGAEGKLADLCSAVERSALR